MSRLDKPRPDVVRLLSNAALDAMEEVGVDDLTVAEVASASYTLARHMTEILLHSSDPKEVTRNKEILAQGLAEIYSILDEGITKH